MFRTISLIAGLMVVCGGPPLLRAEEPTGGPPRLPPAVNSSFIEAEIEAALRRPVLLDIEELSLTDACAKIGQQVGIEIRLHQKSLADAAIDPSVRVTYKIAKPIPLAFALDWLEDFELSFLVRDDVLLITSKEFAEGVAPTRVYPIDDLISEKDRSRQTFAAAPNSKLIRAPSGWALVHSGNRESHAEMAELLAEIRATRDPRRADPDAEIEAALKKPVKLDIEEESLLETVRKISEQTGLDIRLDQKAMADAAIDPSVLVTFKTQRPVSLSAALDLMLDDYELTHVIHHGWVQITSKEKADGLQVWRAYLVDDLVKSGPGQDVNFGPLIQLIEDQVAPDSWDTNVGVGSIRPLVAPWGCLILFPNTRQVHAQAAALLADLRAVKQQAGADPRPPIDPKARYMAAYNLGGMAGPELIKVITEAVAPESWQAGGGAGRMWSVSMPAEKEGGGLQVEKQSGAPQTAKTWMLIVSQTPDVHRQLAELIPKLTGRARLGEGMGSSVGVIETVPPISSTPIKSAETPSAKPTP